jgi:hypothetical protein
MYFPGCELLCLLQPDSARVGNGYFGIDRQIDAERSRSF